MDSTTALTQYYLKVQALTPQSGAPIVTTTDTPTLTQQWFGLSLMQISIFAVVALVTLGGLTLLKLRSFHQLGSLLLFLFLASTIPVGVILTNQQTQLQSSASPSVIPKNVIIQNVTFAEFTLLWETDKSGIGVIRLRTQPDQTPMAKIIQETSNEPIYQHNLHVTNLLPNTTYYFEILSGDTWYDNNGVPITVTTTSTSLSP